MGAAGGQGPRPTMLARARRRVREPARATTVAHGRSPPRALHVLALALCAAVATARAAEPECRATSGERTLPLVELYTSEGCSSCPPADRWFARLPVGPGAAMPLAFHVDYWDRLGWPDRFARAEWSARQQAIARDARTAVVFTPQVLLQGRDFAAWRGAEAARALAQAASIPARADIAIDASPGGAVVAVVATARVRDAAQWSGARLVVAYVDSGHVTEVRRGENAGATLVHDHVVRALVAGGAADASGALRLEATFELPADAGRDPRLVAFVERGATREVLQALPLALERCGRRGA